MRTPVNRKLMGRTISECHRQGFRARGYRFVSGMWKLVVRSCDDCYYCGGERLIWTQHGTIESDGTILSMVGDWARCPVCNPGPGILREAVPV